MVRKNRPLVGILMGSKSDADTMFETEKILKEYKIPYEINVLSAHRNPDKVRQYAKSAKKRGLKVLICGAGMSAALAGVVSSFTDLPVIGVPVYTTALKGIDSFLSTMQMPAGVPVAAMAIGKPGAKNAAIFAARILGRV
ncbi:MAG: 5-(carboxyamino)imidazole ribonucleotide mutase [Candidatus Omnitrophica bacterium]|nr:5-(carboxyamino)imidazole ribonucleotide mutase [Candidatus Omnitrophota bacterium]MBU1933506.1 5-(carboxyamino)imidazole ribonucleotide mutase [Candidatus Omnitrophota bacterium]